MSVLDVFNTDAFSVTSMTKAINDIPFVPGQLGAMGVFAEDGVATTSIMIERQGMTLGLVAPTQRGAPGETAPKDGRNVRNLVIPHFQRDDAVMADEVQGVRAFGTENTLATLEALIQRKMRKHTIALDATIEHQRIGAVKGVILDKNGNTIYNLATEFGLSLPTDVDFTLGTSTTKLRTVLYNGVVLPIENALDGLGYTGIVGLVGKDFWPKLIEHAAVKETYLNWQAAAELRGLPLDRFEFGGVTWIRYRTGNSAANALATPAEWVPAADVRFFPTGVDGLFETVFAPADYEETVNTIGLPRYSKQYAMPNGKGRSVEVQTNSLSYCTRPNVLVRGTTSN